MNPNINTTISKTQSLILFMFITTIQITALMVGYLLFADDNGIRVFAEEDRSIVSHDTNSFLNIKSDFTAKLPLVKDQLENLLIEKEAEQRAILLSSRTGGGIVYNGEPRKAAEAKDDLMSFKPVTADQMNHIIDSFIDYKNETIPFKNKGDIFVRASELTGYNPIYLFAHASLESGYGTSKLATTKYNYFGIAAFDHDPNNAYTMADSVDAGIINGAIWIKDNYYNAGQGSLHDMIYKYPNHCYSSSEDEWIEDILWIMNKFPIQ